MDEAQFWFDATPLGFDVDENEQQLRQHRLNAAQADLEAAQARQAGLSWQAGLLAEMSQQPLALMAEMHQAEAQVELAEANVEAASAEVDMLVKGPTPAERDFLDAQVRLAESQLILVEALIDQVVRELKRADQQGTVRGLELSVGRLSGVNCESVRFAFGLLAPGTSVENAEIVIHQPKAVCHCRACGARVEIDDLVVECSECAGGEIAIEGGRDLILQSIEVEETVP